MIRIGLWGRMNWGQFKQKPFGILNPPQRLHNIAKGGFLQSRVNGKAPYQRQLLKPKPTSSGINDQNTRT